MKTYTVAIIGCGSIGALKPDHIDFPGSENILTHANAVDRHPRTDLTALVDIDDKRLKRAEAKWNPRTAARKIDDLRPDIVIVATPTEIHYKTLHQMIVDNPGSRPKLIIAEKPFCLESQTARSITESYSNLGISIMVDYIRRFAQGYKNIKKQIDSDTFGKAQNVRILYGRGLKHEGCHALDLMRHLFGECLYCQYMSNITAAELIDRDKDDPSGSAFFTFEGCGSVIFQACDGRKYGIFEIDICFKKARLRFIDNGLYIEKYPINEENEWGHKSLDYKLTSVVRQETGLNIALYGLIDNAVNFLDGKEGLICTARDAIEVHEILEELK